jgi:1,4-dihydroxy-2-naphthoate octaprenyltransferase
LIRGELALAKEATMTDLVFIVIAIAFFGLAIAYTYGCARLQRGPHG